MHTGDSKLDDPLTGKVVINSCVFNSQILLTWYCATSTEVLGISAGVAQAGGDAVDGGGDGAVEFGRGGSTVRSGSAFTA